MIELTEQQRRELHHNGETAMVHDPDTGATYVLVRQQLYDRLKALLTDEWSPDQDLAALAESGARAGWLEPIMDDYDHYDDNLKRR